MNNYEVYLLDIIHNNELDNSFDLDRIADILATGIFQLI